MNVTEVFLIAGLMAGLSLMVGHWVSKIDIKNVTAEGIIGRYIYGTAILLMAYALFLYYVGYIWLWPWLAGITCIAGGLEVLSYVIDYLKEKLNQAEMVENDDPELSKS